MRPGPGGLGGTFAGSPLACAAGLAVLEVMREEQLLTRAQDIGRFMTHASQGPAGALPVLRRGARPRRDGGSRAGEERPRRSPDPELTRALVQAAGRHGLIILSCGVYANVIRFLAPLTIPDALLKEGFRLFEPALDEVAGER